MWDGRGLRWIKFYGKVSVWVCARQAIGTPGIKFGGKLLLWSRACQAIGLPGINFDAEGIVLGHVRVQVIGTSKLMGRSRRYVFLRVSRYPNIKYDGKVSFRARAFQGIGLSNSMG